MNPAKAPVTAISGSHNKTPVAKDPVETPAMMVKALAKAPAMMPKVISSSLSKTLVVMDPAETPAVMTKALAKALVMTAMTMRLPSDDPTDSIRSS